MKQTIRNFPQGMARQQGALLVTSLLILMILTLIGVTSLQTTTLEERMAGNIRDRDISLQAAEAALRDAEEAIRVMTSAAAFNDLAELYSQGSTLAPDVVDSDGDGVMDHLDVDSDVWSSNRSTAAATSLPFGDSAITPRYYIQHGGESDDDEENSSLNLTGYGQTKAGDDVTYFRITAYSAGASGNARVIIRSHYGMRF